LTTTCIPHNAIQMACEAVQIKTQGQGL
jgi:hypothetical protein